MATLIAYLSDDFDGGETEFDRLGIKVKPPIGSALLFYNYVGGGCSSVSSHRSNAVRRGTKEVLQRWYAYPEQPFLAERPYREPGDGLAPFQPLVICDWTQSAWTNVSCRWYNSASAIAPEVLQASRRDA